jgi:DNA polymerase sigma
MRYLNVDITFEDQIRPISYHVDDRTSSSSATKCIQKIKEMSKLRSDLKPLVLVLKKLLQNYNLNHTYTGGLNSYSLVLMAFAFL